MSKKFIASSRLAALLAVGLAALAPSGVGAASAGRCGGLVGTYLTKNSVAGGSQRLTSRSLMSFTSSGQIFFTDSGEGGEAGYAPFTDGRGGLALSRRRQGEGDDLGFHLAGGWRVQVADRPA